MLLNQTKSLTKAGLFPLGIRCVPTRPVWKTSLLTVLMIGLPLVVNGQAPRAFPEGEKPDDVRLQPLKDLNGYFPFEPPKSEAEWNARSEYVRRQLLVAVGLWPMPERTPLNAVVHSPIEKEDYTVEHVYFEAMPGFFVTGNLYRPKDMEGKKPGVLCPHGHWANGRFYDSGDAATANQIKIGAEERDEAGHSPLQARCVHLARMGCVVFHYDMIGYADSKQIPDTIAHRFEEQRAEMNRESGWGLFSPQAESHLQSVMGLQTFSSIRSLDFLETLPDVDKDRLAVTGASGGGTQTFMLAALDPRPVVAFPAVMVSTAMQGGCTCENCALLRVNTGNIEIAALFAPKPMALSAADDWTKEMDTKGFPELKATYELLGAGEKVDLISRTEFDHNYNFVCRTFMYEWFNKYLDLDADIAERGFDRLTTDEMTVFNDDHPRPPGGDDFERDLLVHWHNDSQQKLAALRPEQSNELEAFHSVYGGALDAIIGRRLPSSEDLEWEQTNKTDEGDHLSISGQLRNHEMGEELPLTFLYPKQWDGTAVLWLTENGKAGLLDDEGNPTAPVQALLDEGVCVTGIDMLFQGEFLAADEDHATTRRVANTREAAAYTFGYNHSLFAQRTHDVLTAIAFVKGHELTPARIVLASTDQTAPIAAAARAIAKDEVDFMAIDSGGFRFGQVKDLHSPYFLPGGAKYGDLPGMLALAAPGAAWIAGEKDEDLEWVEKAYFAAQAGEAIKSSETGDAEAATKAIVAWLIEESN